MPTPFQAMPDDELSDLADGYIARRYGMVSRLGAMLDPVADKLNMFVATVTLAWQGSDTISGVASYTMWASEDGGTYVNIHTAKNACVISVPSIGGASIQLPSLARICSPPLSSWASRVTSP